MNPSREGSQPASPILSLGRYALFGELATGGMATVHFARMSSLGGFNRTVAVKRMRPNIARDPEFVAMFLDEARLTSRIEHPNVVATLDVVAESGEVFLVMEYVRGESLQRLRRAARTRREKVPVPVGLSIMVGALAGLHAAHEAEGEDGVPLGIIHRDVSPHNIMVGEDGIARITDFGIAKAESRLQVTQEGQMKGKLPYMAPEQLGSSRKKIDRRVDIFSAAVVLWELFAGKRLFRADHPGETIAKVLSAPIPALAPYRPDVSPALDRALHRALSRDPDRRPQTAEAFALELEEATDKGLASPRLVGAWVSSLAGEVLANRLKYVREMESVSFELAEAKRLDPHLDRATPPFAPPTAERDPARKPPVPPAVTGMPRVPGPSESSMPSMPSDSSMSSMPSMPSDSSMPSMTSGVVVGPDPLHSDPSLSIPPFRKNRWLPFVIAGALVAGGVVVLVVAVLGSSSLFGGDPAKPAATMPDQQHVTPSEPRTVEPGVTEASKAIAPEVVTPEPAKSAKDASSDTLPSEEEKKGGSSGMSTSRPAYTGSPNPTKGSGTRPYLPDLP